MNTQQHKTATNAFPVRVYSPESALRHPFALLGEMFRDLWISRGLAWRLFVRDISAQYRQSILGYVWAFIPPLMASLPFIFLNSQGVIAIEGTPIPYAAFAMIGTIIWQVFVDALTTPIKTISNAKTMLARINFPREAILLAALGQVFFNLLVRLLLLIAILAWFRITPPATALLFPVGILGLIAFGFMIGLLLTPLGLLYKDFQNVLPVGATFLMFLTPVLYPAPRGGLAASVAHWNPLTPLVTVTRDALTTGNLMHLQPFMQIVVLTIVLLFVGWVFYRLALPHIIARMGN